MTPMHILLRMTPALVAALLGVGAWAQPADPPARVARLAGQDGTVTFAPAGDSEWTDARPNRPLVRGDRLWTDKGSRASVQVGSTLAHMDGQTQLTATAVDDQSVQLSITQGSVAVRVRALPEGENFELDTPNLAFRAAYPGEFRLDVDPLRGTTRVTVQSGAGAVYGEGGQSVTLGGGQQVMFRARTLAKVTSQEAPPQDNFDRWVAERNRRDDQSVSARFVPRDLVGYPQLDASGKWTQDPKLGAVWTPVSVDANWAPYRNGRWEWIAPWGWTWIDDAPWAFATSHYGRWTQVGTRWAWVPGQPGLHPVYAPALVGFASAGPQTEPAKAPVAWFPLAPGEAWQPPYAATQLYISNVNHGMPPVPKGNHLYQRRPDAITAMAADDFRRGKSASGNTLRLNGALLAQSQVVPAPPAPAPAARPVAAKDASGMQQVATTPAPMQPAAPQAQPSPPQTQEAPRVQPAASSPSRSASIETPRADAARPSQDRDERQLAKKPRTAPHQSETAGADQKSAAHARAATPAAATGKAAQGRVASAHATHPASKSAQLAKSTPKSQSEGKHAQASNRNAPQAKHENVAHKQAARREPATSNRRTAATRSASGSSKQVAKRASPASKPPPTDDEAATARAQQMDLARRAADQDAQALRNQRLAREQSMRGMQPQPVMRPVPIPVPAPTPTPDGWQRGIPILNPGRTS